MQLQCIQYIKRNKLRETAMVEFLRHALGLCGEPHPSLLTLIASMPLLGYYIHKLKRRK